MACQKVCIQGRDDIKVNIKSPIPASFSNYRVRCRDGAWYFILPSLSYHLYLVCIPSGMPSMHPTYIFDVFVFLYIEDCVGRWFVQLSSYILVTQVKGPGLNSL